MALFDVPALFRRGPRRAVVTPDAPSTDQPERSDGFDAVVQIGPFNLPPGVAIARAMAVVRRAVRVLPGAGAVSVQHHPLGTADAAICVYAPDTTIPAREPVRLIVLRAVHAALAGLAEAAPLPATGFADSQRRFVADDAVISAASHDGSGRSARDPLAAMTDTALLTRLLEYVLPGSAAAIAPRVIHRFGSFAAVLSAPDAELREVAGLGTHCLAAIRLVQAASLRLARGAVMDQPLLDGSDALIDYLTAVLARESIEHFRILFLDAEGRLRADEAQARGTVNHTPVYPREVARRALELRASSLILVHNHPSGDPSPSVDDIDMTARVAAAAKAVGLHVRDHIIVGAGRWLSFRREGLLDD